MAVGAGQTIEDAVGDAVSAMARLIVQHGECGIADEFHARKFLGLAGRTLFGQHCCPIKTVRVAVPLEYLPGLRR